MAPRFRVRADVLHYVVMLAVGAGGAYAFSRMYGLSDEEIENELVRLLSQCALLNVNGSLVPCVCPIDTI